MDKIVIDRCFVKVSLPNSIGAVEPFFAVGGDLSRTKANIWAASFKGCLYSFVGGAVPSVPFDPNSSNRSKGMCGRDFGQWR